VRKAYPSVIARQKAVDPRVEYKAGEPKIDWKRHEVSYETENHKPDGTILHVREVAFPGKTGVVKLTFFHWKGADQTAWESMLDSVHFDSGFEYDEAAVATGLELNADQDDIPPGRKARPSTGPTNRDSSQRGRLARLCAYGVGFHCDNRGLRFIRLEDEAQPNK
ncbi:MAG TPA: hypothetical protein VKA15_21095, partial [Isosphaeraceae bacterium]|nr:hypothetical protein [Isosphaeraceae bacterium]